MQPTQTHDRAEAATSLNPQIEIRPGDWKCHSCNNTNFAARIACHQCGQPKQQPVGANASSSVTAKPADWTCQSCNMNNFASRVDCRKCNQPKQGSTNVNPPPPVASKPGDWKCSSCPETNFGSRVVCRSCGASRPSTESSPSDSTKECVICMEKPIDSVITTCGHSAMCLECGALVTQCPICRNPFNQQQIIKLFHAH